MKLSVDQSGFELLLKRMGAKRREWVPDEIIASIRETRNKLKSGIIGALDSVDISNGGLLSYEGQQISIYIRDHTSNHLKRKNVLDDAKHGRRIHIFDCSVLKEMRLKNRYDRYVQTVETKSFEIDVTVSGKVETRKADLKVCKVCLKTLKYNGYTGGETAVWKEFNLEEFFAKYSTFFAIQPRYNDFASPNSEYVANWSSISRKIRENSNWICSKCGCDLSAQEHRKYLHVHHINGVKSANSLRNLVPLCELCHSKEPSHQHMKVTDKVKNIIQKLRPSA